MAGSGRKVFTAGDVLTASDVQNYLQDQTVMVFGGTAARSAAIATPTEGMLALTTDNDEFDYYHGSAWVPALPIGAWETWAPTLSGGWANGNGTWTARYVQIGKTVHVAASFIIGSTTTKGTTLTVSLPVNMFNQSLASGSTGRAGIGGAIFPLLMGASNAGAINLWSLNASLTYGQYATTSATVPATWATNDTIIFGITYQAA